MPGKRTVMVVVVAIAILAALACSLYFWGRYRALSAAEDFIAGEVRRGGPRYAIYEATFCRGKSGSLGWQVTFLHPVHGREVIVHTGGEDAFGTLVVGRPLLFWSYHPRERTRVRW